MDKVSIRGFVFWYEMIRFWEAQGNRGTAMHSFVLRTIRHAAALVVCAAALMGCASSISLDEPIESRVWFLTALGMQPVANAANPQNSPQLTFDGTHMSGMGGCNRIASSYERQGNQLQFGTIAVTRMACLSAERNELEAGFLAALNATTGYRVSDTVLWLLDTNGQTLAKFEAAKDQ